MAFSMTGRKTPYSSIIPNDPMIQKLVAIGVSQSRLNTKKEEAKKTWFYLFFKRSRVEFPGDTQYKWLRKQRSKETQHSRNQDTTEKKVKNSWEKGHKALTKKMNLAFQVSLSC